MKDAAFPADLADEAVDLLREAIRHDTSNPPGREASLAQALTDYLKDAGLDPALVEAAPGRTNVVARLPGDGSLRPLLLSAHLDVVPADPAEWRHPPFAAEIHDGYVWGRGAVDMKAMAAMSAVILKALAREGGTRKRDVVFAGVADEEAGGALGAGFLCREHRELVDAEYGLTEVGRFTLPFGATTLVPVRWRRRRRRDRAARAGGQPLGSLPHDDSAITRRSPPRRCFEEPLAFRPTREARKFLGRDGAGQGSRPRSCRAS
ncbi:MAG: M20/M25/M40 family metallo-hydrolase [Acidobacteriota bacterium]